MENLQLFGLVFLVMNEAVETIGDRLEESLAELWLFILDLSKSKHLEVDSKEGSEIVGYFQLKGPELLKLLMEDHFTEVAERFEELDIFAKRDFLEKLQNFQLEGGKEELLVLDAQINQNYEAVFENLVVVSLLQQVLHDSLYQLQAHHFLQLLRF